MELAFFVSGHFADGKWVLKEAHAVEAVESALEARVFLLATSSLASLTLPCSVSTACSKGGTTVLVCWVIWLSKVMTVVLALVVS